MKILPSSSCHEGVDSALGYSPGVEVNSVSYRVLSRGIHFPSLLGCLLHSPQPCPCWDSPCWLTSLRSPIAFYFCPVTSLVFCPFHFFLVSSAMVSWTISRANTEKRKAIHASSLSIANRDSFCCLLIQAFLLAESLPHVVSLLLWWRLICTSLCSLKTYTQSCVSRAQKQGVFWRKAPMCGTSLNSQELSILCLWFMAEL